jgi:O-antigen/teichoic acid export membrane protein
VSAEKSSYRDIMKATSLFGGVQIFNIFIQIIRSKVVATLLGPAGMGIMGLLNSTIDIIGKSTNFGLGLSAVKNIAAANSTKNKEQFSLIVIVLRRLVYLTGLLGMLVGIFLSPWLSLLAFGNKDYTLAFILISSTLLFSQLSKGQIVILQGMRKLKYLARANILGSSISLLITIPFYYSLGIDGIVPGIIVSSLITLIISWFYFNKISINPIKVSWSQTIGQGKSMAKMGFMLALSSLLTVGVSYIIRIYISSIGGIQQVGLFSAGFVIINTYVGLVFSAMGTDYYPRLSAIAYDNKLCKQAINQQAEIAIIILSPLLLIFLTYIKWIIIVLYSDQFIEISGMIYWATVGMYFKVASWPIGYIFLAKGASKLFFWNELVTNIYLLGFNLIGYHYGGLTGLGIAFAISYFFHLLQIYFVSKIKFSFTFEKTFVKLFIVQFSLAFLSFLSINFANYPYTYLLGSVLFFISAGHSILELNKRLNLREILLSFSEKKN